jgi:cytochrome c oxidase subunit 2
MWQTLPLFPKEASSLAGQVDQLYLFLVAVSVFFSAGIFLTIFYFAIRYRRARHPHALQVEGALSLELTWSLIPMGLTMIMFVWGASLFFSENRPPRDSLKVYVVGKQWMWKVEHMDGTREINELHVPVNRDIELITVSQDVIHSFFIPEFRIKQDVLPGRYRRFWFRPTRVGTYHLFCSEYCGTQHSHMTGQVVVMEPAAYEQWLGGGSGVSLSASGERLFQQLGCATCHKADASGRGPSLVGLFGGPVKMADGRTLVVDENYLRTCITNPDATRVAGFPAIMPNFSTQVSEEGLLQLVEYIKSLQKQPGQPAAGAATSAAGSKVQ